MGSAGQIVPDLEYLKSLRTLTSRYDILLIFDEVVTGRLSLGGAQAMFGVMPDLTTLGKIIGGGLPIGAFGGKRDIMKLYDPREKIMYHSGTFNGNAISMAAGLAAMEAYDQEKVDHVNRLGQKFYRGLTEVAVKLGLDIQINGVGSIFNTIFSNKPVTSYRDMATSHEDLNELLFMTLLVKGLFIAPRGMFCMSTAMKESDIDYAIEVLHEALFEMLPVIEEKAPELIK
jgi:glutamate-1-semialdehyde 2,1-aminomutase